MSITQPRSQPHSIPKSLHPELRRGSRGSRMGRAALLMLAPLAVAWSGLACTGPKSALYRSGQMPLSLDTTKIVQLDIAKTDPRSGDTWSTSLKKSADGKWAILSGPGGRALRDRRAAGGFILHLLDTLKTLQITGVAGDAQAETFGLKPPRYALRWMEPSGVPSQLEIGIEATSGAGGTFARIDEAVYTVNGAALRMLDYIESFSILREQTWLAPIASDDIDEVEIASGTRKFYAQREGDVWTDRKNRRIKTPAGDIGALLDVLTHARAQEFVDDAPTAVKTQAMIEKNPLYSLTLKGRRAAETRLLLQWVTLNGEESAYGFSSSRPDAIVRLYPAVMHKLAPLFRR